MARLFNTHLLFIGQLMLHRRFLFLSSTSSSEDSFAYSRKAALDASLGALHIQSVLDEETCPGGQLHTMRWRVSSIMNHTFLTATMVLCAMLHRGQTLGQEDNILGALKKARTIWLRAGLSSYEAKKAAQTTSIVIARATESGKPQGLSSVDQLPQAFSDMLPVPTGSGNIYGVGFDDEEHHNRFRDIAKFDSPFFNCK
jgi:hypothetical protein